MSAAVFLRASEIKTCPVIYSSLWPFSKERTWRVRGDLDRLRRSSILLTEGICNILRAGRRNWEKHPDNCYLFQEPVSYGKHFRVMRCSCNLYSKTEDEEEFVNDNLLSWLPPYLNKLKELNSSSAQKTMRYTGLQLFPQKFEGGILPDFQVWGMT